MSLSLITLLSKVSITNTKTTGAHGVASKMSNNPTAAPNWFLQYTGFSYDTTEDLRSNFNELATSRNWGAKCAYKKWVQCQTSLFGSLYGTNTSNLQIWQDLCTEVGIPGTPSSITACKKALGARKVRVNLVNLIEHRLSGVPVIRFKNDNEFRAYTLDNRTYPLKAAKEDGFIKTLLRHVL